MTTANKDGCIEPISIILIALSDDTGMYWLGVRGVSNTILEKSWASSSSIQRSKKGLYSLDNIAPNRDGLGERTSLCIGLKEPYGGCRWPESRGDPFHDLLGACY